MKKSSYLSLGLSLALLSGTALAVPEQAAAISAEATLPVSVQQPESSYTLYLQPERQVIPSAEVEERDAVIRTYVYLKGSRSLANPIFSAAISYAKTSPYLHFRNSINLQEPIDHTETIRYSGGSFFSNVAMPFCFGAVDDEQYYTLRSATSMTAAQLCDPHSGSVIYSDGAGGLYFTRSYFKMNEDATERVRVSQEKVEISADQLQHKADGTTAFTYQYYEQSAYNNYPLYTATCTIPNYNPTLPAGTPLDGENDAFSWFSLSGAEFLGYTDEFPLFAFDIVVSKGTPDGIYPVTFTEENCRIMDTMHNSIPLHLEGVSIVVGGESATISKDNTPSYFCAFTENSHPITLSQISTAACTAAVTYESHSTSNSNLHSIATSGISPNALCGSKPYLITDVPFFCGDVGYPLYNTNATIFTKKILMGKKGDITLDGAVSVEDAVKVLEYYAQQSAGLTPVLGESLSAEEQTLAFFLGDIDTASQNGGKDGSVLSVEDATEILFYYAQQSAQLNPIWNSRW